MELLKPWWCSLTMALRACCNSSWDCRNWSYWSARPRELESDGHALIPGHEVPVVLDILDDLLDALAAGTIILLPACPAPAPIVGRARPSSAAWALGHAFDAGRACNVRCILALSIAVRVAWLKATVASWSTLSRTLAAWARDVGV
jgi:hypothetical protein